MSNAAKPPQRLNHWLRLGIPCCLGAAAGVFNYLAIDSKLTPTRFCVITETIPAGGFITPEAIGSCDVTGGDGFLRYAVPYNQVRGFLGSRATHRIDRNSILLWQHLDHTAPHPVGEGEIEVALDGKLLGGVDLPEQLFAGDRLLLQVAEEHGSRKAVNLKYHELGPFTASKVAYLADDKGKSLVEELRLIVKKRSRQYRELMDIKRGESLELVHIGRTS